MELTLEGRGLGLALGCEVGNAALALLEDPLSSKKKLLLFGSVFRGKTLVRIGLFALRRRGFSAAKILYEADNLAIFLVPATHHLAFSP
jgi:hypothetical protein